MIGWLVELLIETIWDGCAELARKVGGKGCGWAIILAPILLFAGAFLYLRFGL